MPATIVQSAEHVSVEEPRGLKAASRPSTSKTRIKLALLPSISRDDDIREGIPDVASLAPLAKFLAKIRAQQPRDPVIQRRRRRKAEVSPGRRRKDITRLNWEPRPLPGEMSRRIPEAPAHVAKDAVCLPVLEVDVAGDHHSDRVSTDPGKDSGISMGNRSSGTGFKRRSSTEEEVGYSGSPTSPTVERANIPATSVLGMLETTGRGLTSASTSQVTEASGRNLGPSGSIAMPLSSKFPGKQHIPVSPRRAAPSLPQPVRAAPSIPVQVPLSILERVRFLRFESSTNVRAHEVSPSPRDKEKLVTFASYVGTGNQTVLFGRQLPQCHVYLVQIEEGSTLDLTYSICIEGQFTDADTRDFYAVMSQRSCRKFYEPWKLCFRRVDVSYVASRRYLLYSDPDRKTLCGTIFRTTDSTEESQVSTIGGLIQVDGQLVAITTAHRPPDPGPDASPSLFASPATTLTGEDFPDDLESALVIVVEEPYKGNISLKPTPDVWTSNSLGTTEVLEEGDDWCLVQVPEEQRLPNCISSLQFGLDYITQLEPDPPLREVIIQAGVSGVHSGLTSPTSSFLLGRGDPQEVWTVNLDAQTYDLQPGDSGSWVIDATSCRVVGNVVARSPRKALFVSLSQQFQRIQQANPHHSRTVELPSPLLLLLDLARSEARNNPNGQDNWLSRIFYLVRRGVLPSDPLARALGVALHHCDTSHTGKEQLEMLTHILLLFGSNLGQALERGTISSVTGHMAPHVREMILDMSGIYRNPDPEVFLTKLGVANPSVIQPLIPFRGQDMPEILLPPILPVLDKSESGTLEPASSLNMPSRELHPNSFQMPPQAEPYGCETLASALPSKETKPMRHQINPGITVPPLLQSTRAGNPWNLAQAPQQSHGLTLSLPPTPHSLTQPRPFLRRVWVPVTMCLVIAGCCTGVGMAIWALIRSNLSIHVKTGIGLGAIGGTVIVLALAGFVGCVRPRVLQSCWRSLEDLICRRRSAT